ncbi:flagellar basal body protein FliL [Micromonospora zingiberis]|uniref:Flagellar basal body protein FliL n=1 Tax=Micromonospora zingiberis TaxID=2053011 RepID=A0A4R0G8X5_9ACTN|nr:flagellar basal body protein FliL [Micromonospora zingiberis]TCB92747.1 flagellar basal body protein FliL [Micromonospora zingiberis]
MANYGPPGGGPQPWQEPRSGEVHGRGQVYGSGPGYGAESTYGGGPHRPGGPEYGPGPHGPTGQYGAPGQGADGPGYGAYPPGGRGHQDDTAVNAYAGQPTPPPERRRGRAPVIATLVAVLVLVLGGGTAYYLLGQDDDATPTAVAAPTQDPPLPTADPDEGDEPEPSTPASNTSTDPRFVQQGQCVRNDAPAGSKPKLLISDCVPSTYEVLRRFDGKTSGEKDAEAKCAQVDGYTNWYFFDSELDSLDFVLCLKRRG